MSNGLGAGFGGLLLLAVLLAIAGLLTLALVGAVLSLRRRGTVPTSIRSLAAVLVVAAAAVSGFAVLALADEAVLLAGVVAGTALVPLLVGAAHLRRTTDLSPIDLLASTGLAWCLPFVLGVIVVFGLTVGGSQALGWTSVQSRQRGLTHLAIVAGGVVALAGTGFVARWLGPRVGWE